MKEEGWQRHSIPGGGSSTAKALRGKGAFQKLTEGQCGWDTESKGSKSGVGAEH